MNRSDRLFAITLLLQARRRMRAQGLARVFAVTERTIYRDMAALSESGVPVVALPGEGYELAAGFYLPPLHFTPDEAAVLFLGAQMLGAHAVGRLAADAERSLNKLAIALPKPLRAEMERLSEIIRFVAPGLHFDLDEPRLATLQQAIREQRVVWIVGWRNFGGYVGSVRKAISANALKSEPWAGQSRLWTGLPRVRIARL